MAVVLITGTSSGIGMLAAARLAAVGHDVYASMRNLDGSHNLEAELERRGAAANLLQLDVTDVESIARAVGSIEKEAGRLDVLINNAGYGLGGFFEDLSAAEIQAQFDTNFFGLQAVTRAALPLMRQSAAAGSWGRIVNISSVQGRMAVPGLGAYTASKFALEGFSEGLYYELQPFNIHVVLIEPGSFRTKIFTENAQVASRAEDPQSPYTTYARWFRDRMAKMLDAPDRMGDAEDVAQVIEVVLQKARPNLRYVVGRRARQILRIQKLLPGGLFHRMVLRRISAR